MKRVFTCCAIFCLLLCTVVAAADTLHAERLIGNLPTASAILVEEVLREEKVEAPAFAKGAPISKRVLNLWVEQIVNGKWKKTSSMTVEVGWMKRFGFGIRYTPPLSYSISGSMKDYNIARFVQSGGYDYIAGVAPGSTKATFVERYSGKKCTLKVKVTPVQVSEIALTSTLYELPVGHRLNLGGDIQVLPGNASNKGVSFKSSNKKVASVDALGYVTAQKAGTAKITIQSKQNKKVKQTVTINVVSQPTTPELPSASTTYRFFGIGQSDYNYPTNDLFCCYNDVRLMGLAYRYSSLNGKTMPDSNVTVYDNLTGNQIRQVLSNMAACGADEDDVTVFFYSGHGLDSNDKNMRGALCGVDNTFVSVDEVRSYLDRIPGKVVVIMDSCLSGQYIQSKSADELQAQAEAAAQHVIDTFADSTAENYEKALTDSANKAKYKIITACQPRQVSTGYSNYSLFTYWAAKGIGMDYNTQSRAALCADANGNSAVSLQELYDYAEKNVAAQRAASSGIEQITMVWPAGDAFPVLTRN